MSHPDALPDWAAVILAQINERADNEWLESGIPLTEIIRENGASDEYRRGAFFAALALSGALSRTLARGHTDVKPLCQGARNALTVGSNLASVVALHMAADLGVVA